MHRGLVVLAAAIVWTAGCDDEAPPPPPLPVSAAPPLTTSSSTTRERTRAYYAANREQICVIYWEEGVTESKRMEIPCPREILSGERIRLAGRTCAREGGAAGRNVPVRCPKQLFYMESDDRRGKGEFKLKAQK